MGFFGLFGSGGDSNKIKEFLDKGAIVLDVRTLPEWNEGHVKGSKHIVLNEIPARVNELKSLKKPIITVCRSGGRASQVNQFLAQHGIEVLNGGAWQNVAQHVAK